MSRKNALFSKRKQDLCMKLEELKDEGNSVVSYVGNIIDQGIELVGDLEGVSDHVVFLQRYPAVIKELDRLLNKIVRLNCNIELNTSDDEVEEKVPTERCVTEEVLLRSKSTIHNCELLTPESSIHLSTGHDVNPDIHNYSVSPEVTHSVPPCPVHIGDILDMRFLHGNSPHNFWLGYYKSRSLDCLNETMLTHYHMKHLQPCDMSLLCIGTYVCAFDGKKCFRGKILRIRLEQPVRLMVLDVDSGRIRRIEQDCVFRLDEEFSKTAVQALNCCLRGNLGDPLLWDDEVTPLFCKLLTESALVVTVCEKDRGDPPQFRVDVDCHNEKRINNKIDVNKWIIFSVVPKLKEMKENGKGDGILKCLYTYLDPVIRDEEDSTEQGLHSDSGCFTEISTPLSQISHSTVSCSVMPVTGQNQFHSQDHEHTTSLSHVELAPCSDIKIQPAESTQNLNLGTDCKVRTELNQSSSAPDTLDHSKECDRNHLTSSSFHMPVSRVTNNVTAESSLLLPDKKNISLHQSVLVSSAGQSYKAMLSHIEDPGEFYIHIVCEDNVEIDSLQNEMTQYYRTGSPAFKSKEEAKCHISSFCAAFYDVDNNWYRAQIIDWNEDNDTDPVIVKYVDYGNKSSVHLSMLRPLRAEFTELPICARRCHLAMICPTTSTEDTISKSWSHEATHLFKCLVKMESVYLVILMESVDDTMSSLSVILQDCQTIGCPIINEFIVELGYAVSFHPSVAQEREQGQNAQNPKTDNDGNDDSLCKEQLCAVDMSSDWNPMAEDYYSEINTLYHDDEDACYVVTGYKPRDENRICRFYARTGRCYKGETCRWEHAHAHPGGWTTDKECMFTDAITKLVLPDVQDEIMLQVTYITKVNMFYAVICNECQSSSDKVQIKRIDIKEEDEKDETLVTLNDYLNEEHNVRALRSCTVMPALGQIVVARFSKDGRFYRARVMDYSDVEICVFYVDYGNREWVSESNIREIEPRYLHLPFQAIECVLVNVDEVSEHLEAKKFFASLVYNKKLHARVVARLCHLSRLEVLLWDDEGCDIGACMIQNGYGRERIYGEYSLVT